MLVLLFIKQTAFWDSSSKTTTTQLKCFLSSLCCGFLFASFAADLFFFSTHSYSNSCFNNPLNLRLFLIYPFVVSVLNSWFEFLQVQSDYDRLRQTFAVVSQERDVAQEQRSQLQEKVDNLEHVLKVGQIFFALIISDLSSSVLFDHT